MQDLIPKIAHYRSEMHPVYAAAIAHKDFVLFIRLSMAMVALRDC
jgi:hypothetical protein